MSYKKAILLRKSRRTFKNETPNIDQIRILKNLIDDINEESNLNIQLIIDNSDAFYGIKSSYGFFKGVRNYIALVGPKLDENVHEKLGYYGEKLLLTCELLELGTCWVGGTFNRDKCKCKVSEEEVFKCVIVFGNTKKKQTTKEKIIRNVSHKIRKDKSIEDMFHSEHQPPNWFIEGMRMVQRAPSALNRMPTKFYYSDETAMAKVKGEKILEYYDLGIANFHFEIGANIGKWDFGNGAIFSRR